MTTAAIPARIDRTAPQLYLWANEVRKGFMLANRRWGMMLVGILLGVSSYLGINFLIGGGHIVEELMVLTLPALMALTIAENEGVEGAGGIAEEINGGTLEQTQLSQLGPVTAVLGRVTALALQGLASAVVLGIGFTTVFGLRYEPHPAAIVPALLTVVDTMGYGLVIVALTLRVASIGAVTHVFNMIIMFFGGMIVPISVFPDGMEAAARIIPTALGVQTLNATLAGESLADTWSDGKLPLLLLHAAVLVSVGLWAYTRNLRRSRREGGVGPR